jgi:hypothetical protein
MKNLHQKWKNERKFNEKLGSNECKTLVKAHNTEKLNILLKVKVMKTYD